ncbi:hypothetical protein GCM10009727_19690 [Actinomadura napierensis]|uniref:Uncharacterized protein n=1 Tax=Actinomadura napierensis TaxID=267854 RepID=A0ABP5K8G8_9ACTN
MRVADLGAGDRVAGGQDRDAVAAQDAGDGSGRHPGRGGDVVGPGAQFAAGVQHLLLGAGRGE